MLQESIQEGAAAQTGVLQLFLEFVETRQTVMQTLTEVEDGLNHGDLSRSQVSELSEKLSILESVFIQCLERMQELNNQAQRAKVVLKIRGAKNEPPKLPQTELSSLKTRHDYLTLQLSSQLDRLSETARLTEEFWAKRKRLSGLLDSVDSDLEAKKAKKAIATQDDLQDCLKDCQVRLLKKILLWVG